MVQHLPLHSCSKSMRTCPRGCRCQTQTNTYPLLQPRNASLISISHLVIRGLGKKGEDRSRVTALEATLLPAGSIVPRAHSPGKRGRACLRKQRGLIRARPQCPDRSSHPLEPREGRWVQDGRCSASTFLGVFTILTGSCHFVLVSLSAA